MVSRLEVYSYLYVETDVSVGLVVDRSRPLSNIHEAYCRSHSKPIKVQNYGFICDMKRDFPFHTVTAERPAYADAVQNFGGKELVKNGDFMVMTQ